MLLWSMRTSDALACRPTMRHRGVVVAACAATALAFAENVAAEVASSWFLEDDAGETTTVETTETPTSDDRCCCDGLDGVDGGGE